MVILIKILVYLKDDYGHGKYLIENTTKKN